MAHLAETKWYRDGVLSVFGVDPAGLVEGIDPERHQFAELYIPASIDVPVITEDVFVKVDGPSNMDIAKGWSMPDDCRLQYDGTGNRVVQIIATLSLILLGGGPNEVASARVALNGTPLAKSQVKRVVRRNRPSPVPVQAMVQVGPGDFIEVWVTNNDSARNLRVESMNLLIFDLSEA